MIWVTWSPIKVGSDIWRNYQCECGRNPDYVVETKRTGHPVEHTYVCKTCRQALRRGERLCQRRGEEGGATPPS